MLAWVVGLKGQTPGAYIDNTFSSKQVILRTWGFIVVAKLIVTGAPLSGKAH